MIPGEYILAEGDILANQGRATQQIVVINTGDRPIQVGSHFHFFEANKALAFDRALAYGMRLNIPSGNAVRFEPGEQKTVTVVELGGHQVVRGFHQLINGVVDPNVATTVSEHAKQLGFKGVYAIEHDVLNKDKG